MSFGLVLSFYCIGAPAGSSNLQLNPKFGRTFIIWKVLALQLNSEFGSFEFGTSTMERSCSPTLLLNSVVRIRYCYYGKILLSNLFRIRSDVRIRYFTLWKDLALQLISESVARWRFPSQLYWCNGLIHARFTRSHHPAILASSDVYILRYEWLYVVTTRPPDSAPSANHTRCIRAPGSMFG